MDAAAKAKFFTSPNRFGEEPIMILVDTNLRGYRQNFRNTMKNRLQALRTAVSHLTSSYENKVLLYFLFDILRKC